VDFKPATFYNWADPMKKLFCLGLASILSGHFASAQQDFSKVEIKARQVSGNIHMLEGAGGNIAVSAGPDGLLIVDDQYAPLAEKIEAALAKLGPAPLKYVLNTHFHGDHTGGNVHFGKQATIVAQTNVRKRLGGGASVSGGLPVVTFDTSLSVHFNGEEIKLIHLGPGHTDGDTIVIFTKANVVHAGDQFFSGRFPNIDLSGGGDVRGYIRNVEQLLVPLAPERNWKRFTKCSSPPRRWSSRRLPPEKRSTRSRRTVCPISGKNGRRRRFQSDDGWRFCTGG